MIGTAQRAHLTLPRIRGIWQTKWIKSLRTLVANSLIIKILKYFTIETWSKINIKCVIVIVCVIVPIFLCWFYFICVKEKLEWTQRCSYDYCTFQSKAAITKFNFICISTRISYRYSILISSCWLNFQIRQIIIHSLICWWFH